MCAFAIFFSMVFGQHILAASALNNVKDRCPEQLPDGMRVNVILSRYLGKYCVLFIDHKRKVLWNLGEKRQEQFGGLKFFERINDYRTHWHITHRKKSRLWNKLEGRWEQLGGEEEFSSILDYNTHWGVKVEKKRWKLWNKSEKGWEQLDRVEIFDDFDSYQFEKNYLGIRINGLWKLWNSTEKDWERFAGIEAFDEMIEDFGTHWRLKVNGKWRLWNKAERRFEAILGMNEFEGIRYFPPIIASRHSSFDGSKWIVNDKLRSADLSTIQSATVYWGLKIHGKWKLWNIERKAFESFGGIDEFEEIDDRVNAWKITINGVRKLFNKETGEELSLQAP